MNTRIKLTISLLFPLCAFAQSVGGVYKIDPLLSRLSNKDTVYVVNFWATWCKPCVAELPSFDSLSRQYRQTNVKVLLVSLDFREDIAKKVTPFLRRHHVKSECVLLDEVNGNDFIDKISKKWTGAIPATYFRHDTAEFLIEKKLNLPELSRLVKELSKKQKAP
jgi:thiol-disulfide isomerase/thioredoxin